MVAEIHAMLLSLRNREEDYKQRMDRIYGEFAPIFDDFESRINRLEDQQDQIETSRGTPDRDLIGRIHALEEEYKQEVEKFLRRYDIPQPVTFFKERYREYRRGIIGRKVQEQTGEILAGSGESELKEVERDLHITVLTRVVEDIEDMYLESLDELDQ